MELNDSSLIRDNALIGEQWCQADSGARMEIIDPAVGTAIAAVPDMGAAETERAITAATSALPAWRALTAGERAALLHRWNDLIRANLDDLALIMTSEQGKPLAEARAEVVYAASFIDWFAEEGRRAYGELIPPHQADKRLLVMRQGVGVCAAITPWNFPAAMITRKAAAALAAGCTMVIKPAEATPLTALALAVLAERAGIPAGVLNLITGAPQSIGATLSADPRVRKLSFTGSTEVGRHLMRQCADSLKRLSLECGGNAPFIVFDDADLDAAVDGAIQSKYRNTGQTCVCANRLLVQDGIHDAFAARLAERVAGLSVGPGTQDGIVQGPLIDSDALAKVQSHLADALSRGARVLTGGRPHALGGTFFEPTVIAGVTPSMRITREETFGPVAPILRFDNEADAVSLANDTEYGLAAYFFTRDLARAWRVSEALEYGIVGLNTGIISTAVAPFGGVKQSGIGREGGHQGIEEYLETKYVCMQVG